MCVCDVAIKAARSSHHVTREVVQVVERALQGVCIHVQDDHVLQRSTAHSLREEKGDVSAAAHQRRCSHHYYFTSFSVYTHTQSNHLLFFLMMVVLETSCASDIFQHNKYLYLWNY